MVQKASLECFSTLQCTFYAQFMHCLRQIMDLTSIVGGAHNRAKFTIMDYGILKLN